MALTKISTDGVKDDAVTLAKQAGGTDGQIITYDASGNPVAVGPGTDGQVLTSTGAGSPPAFEDLPASGATINNATENEIVTVASNNAQLDAEANLTFDGSDLTITNPDTSNKGIKLISPNNYYPSIIFDADRSTENNAIVWIDGKWNGTTVGAISVEAGDDTNNKNDGKITFYTAQGGTSTRKMAIEQDGHVHIDDGDLKLASGHGIDFSATSDSINSASSTSELLADYEEGTFTPTNSIGLTITNNTTAHYTKIGRVCHIQIDCTFSGAADSAQCGIIQGLPFTSKSGCVNEGALQFYSNTSDAKLDESDDNTRIFIGASESRIDIQNITGGTFQTRAFMVGRRFRIQMTYLTA